MHPLNPSLNVISTIEYDIVKNCQIISNYYRKSNSTQTKLHVYRRHRHENEVARNAELISKQYR